MQQVARRNGFSGRVLAIAALVFFAIAAWGQSAAPEEPASALSATATTPSEGVLADASASPSALRMLIGPGDELELTVYGIADLNQRVRVDSNGEISLALVGNVPVAGLTAEEAQQIIEARYVNGGYLKDPHITVFVKEYTTQKVTIGGEVSKPGVYPLASNHRLRDVILAAGGLTDKAGKTISISHAADPGNPQVLTLADEDPVKAAENNVEILPGDTVVVSRAGIVYVIGEVHRAGGYVMENNGTMTASQAVAKAAGPTGMASLNGTRVIRRTPDGLKTIELPLSKVLEAKVPDMPLQAEDIVYVPNSKTKSILSRGSSSVLMMLTGLVIYR